MSNNAIDAAHQPVSGGGGSTPGLIERLMDWDRDTSERLAVCSDPSGPWGRTRWWLKLVEYSGHGVPWLVGVCSSIVLADSARKRDVYVNFLGLLLFDILVLLIVKAIIRRERPAYNVGDHVTLLSDKYSFPSGHATRAATVTAFVLCEFYNGYAVVVLVPAWMVMCCVSRVILGRHHILDVFAGMIMGFLEYLVFRYFLWLSPEI